MHEQENETIRKLERFKSYQSAPLNAEVMALIEREIGRLETLLSCGVAEAGTCL